MRTRRDFKRILKEPDEKIKGHSFNAGYQNQTIADIAQIVKRGVEEKHMREGEIDITTTPTDDIRSYRITCDKLEQSLGFKPKRTIEDAVSDLCDAFTAEKIPNPLTDTNYVNIKKMQEIEMK